MKRFIGLWVPGFLTAALGLSGCNADWALVGIGGCKVEGKSGSWGDLWSDANYRVGLAFHGLDPHATPGCPILIAQPGERLFGGATVYDHNVQGNQLLRRMQMKFINSRNADLHNDYYYSEWFDHGVRSYELYGQYPAATGRMTYDDRDFMIMRMLDRCCALEQLLGFVELRLDYQHDSGFRFSIHGEDVPKRNTTQTWTIGSPSAGYPHSYAWYVDGIYAGDGPSFVTTVGTQSFLLRADGTDQIGRSFSATRHVDVDGVRAAVAGPDNAFSHTEETWVASARGGYEPYSFQWDLDGVVAGGGTSWTGYPGEGHHRLSLTVVDSWGRSNKVWMDVMGIGDPAGGCEPLPGQLKCEGH